MTIHPLQQLQQHSDSDVTPLGQTFSVDEMRESAESLNGSELVSYSYSYPHKSSYRRLDQAIPIAHIWEQEPHDSLSLYVHVPFCEMRCGFCNLFTQSQPNEEQVDSYLKTLHRQIRNIREELGPVTVRQFAIGGGTPSILSVEQLQSLFSEVEAAFDFSIEATPTSMEVSPSTVTPEKLALLSEFGVERLSIGIQSFDDYELGRIGRPQRASDVDRAFSAIQNFRPAIVNVDLIYGDPRQTLEDWIRSLHAALAQSPEEIYLYPLYVRPETGLGRQHRIANHRSDLYRSGRDLLHAAGYTQVSLRCFRLATVGSSSEYSCQRDGMIGLGCGARSYTRTFHYSTRFATTQAGIRTILRDWIAQSSQDLRLATHGIRLDGEEQRRRHVILSLLQTAGLLVSEFLEKFDTEPVDGVPELVPLIERDWVAERGDRLVLTEAGMENSDIVGPALYSHSVRTRLREFIQR